MRDEVRIFCRSASALPRRAIAEFIVDGAWFDPDPHFDPPLQSLLATDSDWSTLTMRYANKRPPILFVRELSKAGLLDAVTDLQWVLDRSRPSTGLDRLGDHLKATLQLFSIRFEDGSLREDTREMLPAVGAFIAKALDGIVEVPQQGRSNAFYDSEFRRFYRL